MQIIWPGIEGTTPTDLRRADGFRGEQHAADTTARRAKCVGCLMRIFPATTALPFMFPRAGSASLAKSGRGGKDCWPHAHLGTCWENFAHAAKCPVALRASIYILNYPEIQPHGPSACLDQCLMAAGVRNLLCSKSSQDPSLLCQGGFSQVSKRNVHVCVHGCGHTCVPGSMYVLLGSRQ